MKDRLARVEAEIESVTRSLVAFERRLAALEQCVETMTSAALSIPDGRAVVPRLGVADADTVRVAAEAVGEPATATDERAWLSAALTLVGRTLIVLGGAYLLRALTEGGAMPTALGVASGFAYALFWLAAAARTDDRRGTAGAQFHGLAAALVAFPILWEGTVRFQLLTPAWSAIALTAFTGAALLVAFHRRLHAVAWIAVLGAMATASALAVHTTSFGIYSIALVITGVTALWLGYLRDWILLRWPVAAMADLMVLGVGIRAADTSLGDPRGLTLGVQLFLLTAYLGSFVARTLFLGREVISFEVVQSAVVMAVGLGGAAALLRATGSSVALLGLACVIVGVCAYAFAFRFIEPRRQWRNLFFFTSLAALFAVTGAGLVLPPRPALVACALAALGCAAVARASGRLILSLHAYIYAAAMAVVSGLVRAASYALGATAGAAWPPLTPAMFLTLGVLAASVAWPAVRFDARWTHQARAVRAVGIGLLVWMATGAAVALVVPTFAGTPPHGLDPGILATLRTATLVGAVLLLVGTPRHEVPIERVWIGYALLGAISLKFVAEDLWRGRPSTLFIALALYGGALILVSKKKRTPA